MVFSSEWETLLSWLAPARLGLWKLWRRFDCVTRIGYDPELSVDLGLRATSVLGPGAHDAVCDELSLLWYRSAEISGYCLVAAVVTQDDDSVGTQCGTGAPLVSLAYSRHVVELLGSGTYDAAADSFAVDGTEQLTDAFLTLFLSREQDA